MSDWGFDFVRLPLSYRLWSDVKNPYEINEEKISRLDEAIYFAEKHGLHTNIAMHRLPGYCVNQDEKIEEINNLWCDKEALDAAAYQCSEIAKRYNREVKAIEVKKEKNISHEISFLEENIFRTDKKVFKNEMKVSYMIKRLYEGFNAGFQF